MEERRPGNVSHRTSNLLSCMDYIDAKSVHGITAYIITINSWNEHFAFMIVNEQSPDHSGDWIRLPKCKKFRICLSPRGTTSPPPTNLVLNGRKKTTIGSQSQQNWWKSKILMQSFSSNVIILQQNDLEIVWITYKRQFQLNRYWHRRDI